MNKEKLRQTALSWQESADSQPDKQNNLYYPLAQLAAKLAAIDESELAGSNDAQTAYGYLVELVASFESLFPFENIGYWAAGRTIPNRLEGCFAPVNEMFDPLARALVERALGESNAKLKAKMLNKIDKTVKATDACCQVGCFSSEIDGIVALANVQSLNDIDPVLLKVLDIYLNFLRDFSQVTNLPPKMLTLMNHVPSWVVNFDQKKARMEQRIALLTILKTSHENRAQHNSDRDDPAGSDLHDDKDSSGAGTTTEILVAGLRETPGKGIPVPAIKEEEEDEEEEFFECEEEEEFFECLPEDELDVAKREREELAEAERLEAERKAALERQQEEDTQKAAAELQPEPTLGAGAPVQGVVDEQRQDDDEAEEVKQNVVELVGSVAAMLDRVAEHLTRLSGKLDQRIELLEGTIQGTTLPAQCNNSIDDYYRHAKKAYEDAVGRYQLSMKEKGAGNPLETAPAMSSCLKELRSAQSLREKHNELKDLRARHEDLSRAKQAVHGLQQANAQVLPGTNDSKGLLVQLRSLQCNGFFSFAVGALFTTYLSRVQSKVSRLIKHLEDSQKPEGKIDVMLVSQLLSDSVTCYQQLREARDGWLSRALVSTADEAVLSGLHAAMFSRRGEAVVKVRTDMRDALDAHRVHEAARLVASPAA